MSNPVLSLQKVHKSFLQGKNRVVVLKGASLDIDKGEVVGLIGPSGSGKSTLLQIAGLLDSPTVGQVIINGMDCTKANDKTRTLVRRSGVGFIYQFHHLLPEFSALENVIMPQLINGVPYEQAKTEAAILLKSLGLAHRSGHRPSELSGGEQQRVAIARAIANKPAVLLADEPTGNLDPETSAEVFKILIDTARAAGIAMLIVTHNHDLANQMDKVVTLSDGVLVAGKRKLVKN
ncbi:MAG: lolD2 [Rickettsiaceae bacterium]|jgi:lipoprotein-releasing system ATP-binding protein|nr:lolD2 [Rickettsiaceae bacterium]